MTHTKDLPRSAPDSARPAQPARPATTRPSPWWVLWLTGASAMVVSLDAFVVTTALPTIRADLHASSAALEWTVTAYTLSFAVLLMTGAALGDRFGRRRVFLAGLVSFAVASAACAAAPDVYWLIAARTVQGAAAAVVMPLALALLAAAFGPQDRARAIGMFAGIIAVSVALGPLVGGAVVQGVSWPWIFWINVPAMIVLVWLSRHRIPDGSGAGGRLDVPGVLLVTVAGFGVVWALVRGNAVGWSSVEVLGTLAGGVLAAAGFVLRENRAGDPMMPMRLFRNRAFAVGNAGVFVLWASCLGTIYFFAQYLQVGLGEGPLSTGLRMLPWGIPPVFVARIVGRLIPRIGARPLVLVGMTLAGTAAALFAVLAASDGADATYWPIAVLLAVHGTGTGTTVIALQAATMTAVDDRDLGKASGTFNTLRQLGGTVGVAASVAAFASAGSYASADTFSDGFAASMTVSAGLAALVLVIGLALPGRQVR